MKRYLVSVLVSLSLALAFVSAGWAVTQFYKQISGVGNVDFNNEVTISDIQVTGPSRVTVRLTSNVETEADHVYSVTLYLDFVPSASSTVSWTAPQVPGMTKMVQFTGLSLGAAGGIGVEVIR